MTFSWANLGQRCVLGMVVHLHWVIGGPVVGYEESPPPAVTVVGIAAVQKVAVEVHSVSRVQLHIYQW